MNKKLDGRMNWLSLLRGACPALDQNTNYSIVPAGGRPVIYWPGRGRLDANRDKVFDL